MNKDRRKCIGFGDKEGKCNNLANGKRKNPVWCDECDKVRVETITKKLEKQ